MTAARVTEIQNLLRGRADARREEFSSTLTWFVAEGFALRLGKSMVRDQLLLCGDLMLHALLGSEAPAEWGVELMAADPTSQADHLARCLKEVCQVEIDDGLDFELRAGIGPGATRTTAGDMDVTLTGSLGEMQLPLQLSVRMGAPVEEAYADLRFPSLLGSGLGEPVMACPPTSAAAFLLHSAVEAGMAAARPKVFWDLHRLVTSGTINVELAPSTLRSVFTQRRTPLPDTIPLVLSDEFAAHESRRQLWGAFCKRARVHAPPLAEVVERTREAAWPWLREAGAADRV